MNSRIIMVLLSLLFMVGCSTYNQSLYQPEVTTTNFHLNVEKISDEEISGTASSGYLFSFIKVSGESKFADGITYGSGTSGEYADLKSAAAYDAIKRYGCDVLIAPRYIIETSNSFFYRSVTVRVYGYPGKYTALHSNN